MAQSALTVTPPNPTPPTNMQFTGATGPNPPNYTKATYADWLDNTKFDTAPPPYNDDGIANDGTQFAANVAALASGTGATAGGTEGTYPGAANGVVPASTSVPHEGAGTEVVVTYNYQTGVTGNGGVSVGISSAPLLQTVSVPRQLHHYAERQPRLLGERGPFGQRRPSPACCRWHRPRPAATHR